jgi:alcohol dehydrogenase (cytochrome c)
MTGRMLALVATAAALSAQGAAGQVASSQAASSQITADRIRNADREPGNWLTYSHTYNGQRYTPLTQITAANASQLQAAWAYQVQQPGKFSTSPLAIDGILYITEPGGEVVALDGRTGRPVWRYGRKPPSDLHACCGATNRGLAVLNDLLFVGTLDSHLLAIDLHTGKLRWDTVVADYRAGHAITVAPLAFGDKVLVGIAGGEYGIRGFLDAYDAKSGRRVWRFWTVPGPGEAGHESWQGDSWKTGGASTWITGTYDPALNLIYWGTGNPGPDYNGDERQGDNLYSCSLIALDADTGKLRWHFQFTPHDMNDWDSTHVPMLVDGVLADGKLADGSGRKLVVVANRNGFYYVLDRATGEFLRGEPFGKQTWASALDAKGRPIRLPDTDPTADGRMVYPGFHGVTNWFSPSFSPLTGLVYVAVREEPATFAKEKQTHVPGQWFSGGNPRGVPKVEPTGAVRALELRTGKLVWEFPLKSPPWAGLMATAGGVVFGGSSEGMFYALDAATGKPLWHFGTGAPIFANPVSFLVNGRQHVAIAAGSALFAFALPDAPVLP